MEEQGRHGDPATPPKAEDTERRSKEKLGLSVNYRPSPLQIKIQRQREGVRRTEGRNGTAGKTPVRRSPNSRSVLSRARLLVPNKGYEAVGQSADHRPLVQFDSDSEEELDMSQHSSGYSSSEINPDLSRQLLKDGYRLDEVPDDEDLDLIPPRPVGQACMCCCSSCTVQ
ncbi:protein FAM219A-like [Petromyzon marinus]|uniref:Protein FAM219A-like n=1 Tax=Petromyzon marinus TaxID=7757 RepID=A0AAJ7WTP3_PETMA|nr:protein FAM219A-like [Petromyzon marinus]